MLISSPVFSQSNTWGLNRRDRKCFSLIRSHRWELKWASSPTQGRHDAVRAQERFHNLEAVHQKRAVFPLRWAHSLLPWKAMEIQFVVSKQCQTTKNFWFINHSDLRVCKLQTLVKLRAVQTSALNKTPYFPFWEHHPKAQVRYRSHLEKRSPSHPQEFSIRPRRSKDEVQHGPLNLLSKLRGQFKKPPVSVNH